MVQVCKRALNSALRDRTVHDETFLAIIAEVEFIVNGRLLTSAWIHETWNH